MRREEELENPSRRCGRLKHPFYGRAPYSDACHVGERLDGAPNSFRHSRSNGSFELLSAHRLCLLGHHFSRSDCDLGWVHQRSPLDLVRNVFDRLGVGIPGFGIGRAPLEEHATHCAVAPTCARGPRPATRICRICPDVVAHGARSRPSGQNVHSRPEGSPDEDPEQALRLDVSS